MTHLQTGDSVRCLCGHALRVEAPVARAPRRLRCGSCAAHLRTDARSCEYCESEISIEERLFAGVCPGCFARLLTHARFCMECGLGTAPQVLSTVAETKSCPRCAGRLRARSVGALHLIECAQCAGLWLDPGVLEALCDERERKSLVQQFLAAQTGSAAVDASARPGPMYLACALCDERMHRRNFGGTSGVVIDTCKDHGLWLDHGELTRILVYVRRGGLETARERAAARRMRELSRAADARPYSGDFERDLFAQAHDGSELGAVVRWLAEGLSVWTRTAK
ncbi:MAG: zf-TFIIB domain-containing protein [Planctomycetota bacterium]